ncbi:hypothetical protein J3E72DRAFT_187864, partial [Bipolaris maydis]
ENVYLMIYFFYGLIVLPSRLSGIFAISSSQLPRLEPATLLDGEILTWAGKYRALVDCPGQGVDGHVYSVISKDRENALRMYEGDTHGIVHASVMLKERDGSEEIPVLWVRR